ncbi:MAG: hypothetical protein Phyf2KO_15610 [Phycisphaerales bacterium]
MRTATLSLIAYALLAVLPGCGSNRTELGYGFYRLDDPAWHIIRRERTEDGEIIDQNWWPDRYELGHNRLFMSFPNGKDVLFCLCRQEDRPLTPSDSDEFIEHLQSTTFFVALRLETAAFEELGTYEEYIAPLDPNDPVRLQIDGGFMIIAGLAEMFGK